MSEQKVRVFGLVLAVPRHCCRYCVLVLDQIQALEAKLLDVTMLKFGTPEVNLETLERMSENKPADELREKLDVQESGQTRELAGEDVSAVRAIGCRRHISVPHAGEVGRSQEPSERPDARKHAAVAHPGRPFAEPSEPGIQLE